MLVLHTETVSEATLPLFTSQRLLAADRNRMAKAVLRMTGGTAHEIPRSMFGGKRSNTHRKSKWPPPFHHGEQSVQERLGVRDIEDWPRKVAGYAVWPVHESSLEQRCYVGRMIEAASQTGDRV